MNNIIIFTDILKQTPKNIFSFSKNDIHTSSFMLTVLKYILDEYNDLTDNNIFIDEHVHELYTIDSKINIINNGNFLILDNNLFNMSKDYILRNNFAFYLDLYNKLIQKEISELIAYQQILHSSSKRLEAKEYIVCMTTCRLADDTNGQNISITVEKTISSICDKTKNVKLYVIDDGSTKEHVKILKLLKDKYNFELVLKKTNGGIAKAKNTCLKIFKESNAEYCFLIDDDIIFKKTGWAEEYINALNECGYSQICLNDFKYIGMVPRLININGIPFNCATHTTGCLIALSRKCLDTIGGFHIYKAKWGGEHHNYYNRCQKAGLTQPDYFLDIFNSKEYIELNTQYSPYSLEEKKEMLDINTKELNCLEIYQEIIE